MPPATPPTIGSPAVISRRTFLAAGAGLVVASACGGTKRGGATPTTGPGASSSTGSTVLVRFFSDGVQAAGTPQRLPFGLGNADGVVTSGGPDVLSFRILDQSGGVVLPAVTAIRHAEGLPRPYWPLQLELATPGTYTAEVDAEGAKATAAFSILEPAKVAIPKPGDRMVPVDTPTTADAHGVTPICTRSPACPLHDVTLRAALAEGKPVTLLIGTPAYCQTGICGPALDLLVAQRDAFPGIHFLHAEIYVDPEHALSSGSTTAQGADLGDVTPVVNAYSLPFEPVLYLAKADGTIANRLDSIYDTNELKAALTALVI